ncbi:hypothetical protein GCM10027192_12240 [Psychrobacter pocilloporae]|jgi:hypothetical protein|uniref:Uncharacterized protein n=1 Tax=Psychrobacter pocilloporae TaxID=1775882 RepID=A0ABT6IQ61_9GAMM|nr:hypothetical protein AOT82_1446 [Psychrobacter sp. AntiMn-1]MDH4903966.1 hypothetical protein [Psychrobacter pocilloporae]BBI66314.1 hypothetical protein PKHYL_05050 [Psychrobacter sp. KH172YL61]
MFNQAKSVLKNKNRGIVFDIRCAMYFATKVGQQPRKFTAILNPYFYRGIYIFDSNKPITYKIK